TTRGRRTGRAARHPAPATGPWESGPKRCSSPGVDSVCSDNRFGARLAVGHLLEPPTNDQTALRVLDLLASRGLVPGGGVSVVRCDNSSVTRLPHSPRWICGAWPLRPPSVTSRCSRSCMTTRRSSCGSPGDAQRHGCRCLTGHGGDPRAEPARRRARTLAL